MQSRAAQQRKSANEHESPEDSARRALLHLQPRGRESFSLTVASRDEEGKLPPSFLAGLPQDPLHFFRRSCGVNMSAELSEVLPCGDRYGIFKVYIEVSLIRTWVGEHEKASSSVAEASSVGGGFATCTVRKERHHNSQESSRPAHCSDVYASDADKCPMALRGRSRGKPRRSLRAGVESCQEWRLAGKAPWQQRLWDLGMRRAPPSSRWLCQPPGDVGTAP